jgi:hypothetical protein
VLVTTLTPRHWAVLLAVGARIVPEVAALDDGQRAAFRSIVGQALADRPEVMRRQLRAFLGIVERAPALRFGATFTRLSPELQDRVLRWLQDCPLELFRKGFWGMKALVLMGYYARPEAGATLGWTPSFDGNARLHG